MINDDHFIELCISIINLIKENHSYRSFLEIKMFNEIYTYSLIFCCFLDISSQVHASRKIPENFFLLVVKGEILPLRK
ncbi:hypothetical protein DERF_013782 [Dermatophagoides farinae]|uniref:Uncharacterized protein n=1 Tax=Dermatophagoides farinae TaxID=6954 RepID=A0A922HN88_DERFA|nr:hypothetical protein DERF_013782 [Dermatophagoides farinae]